MPSNRTPMHTARIKGDHGLFWGPRKARKDLPSVKHRVEIAAREAAERRAATAKPGLNRHERRAWAVLSKRKTWTEHQFQQLERLTKLDLACAKLRRISASAG